MARRNLAAPSASAADWAVVLFALGIMLFFALPGEPSLSLLIALLATTAALAWRTVGNAQFTAILAFCILCGAGRAAWHTEAADHTILPDRGRYHTVTGWVEDVERGGKGLRAIIRVDTISNVADPPPRVRVNTGEVAPRAGQGVTFRARLYAPPPPATPGGYNSARAAYYRGIGAYGRVVSDVEPADIATPWPDRPARWLATQRHRLATRVRDHAPPETAGLQAALITGVRHGIPPEQVEALRDAGLAHMIAISGLHMAVFAGYAYSALCWLFSHLPAARARDMRKPAAALAFAVAAAYLAISGASVSTQRAFVMIGVMLLAVILDRQPFSLRSVSLAALITLALHPEAILSAGFHMSFAAVAALVVVYGWWNARRERFPEGPIRKAWTGFTSMAATSVIAGLATSGFAILHFGRLARYGLAGNLAAMPVFTVLTMPAAMVALLLMPLGLEAAPLWVMGKSLAFILWVAHGVSSWPGAVAYLPGAHPAALVIFAVGLTLLLLGRHRVRLAGVACLAAVPMTAFHTPAAEMRVSDRGVVTLVQEGRAYTTNPRADAFGRRIWLEGMGLPTDTAPLADIAACDGLGCDLTLGATQVAIISSPAEARTACTTADLVILTDRAAVPPTRRACAATLIDADSLRISGAVSVRLQPSPRIVPARKRRHWDRP